MGSIFDTYLRWCCRIVVATEGGKELSLPRILVRCVMATEAIARARRCRAAETREKRASSCKPAVRVVIAVFSGPMYAA